MANPGSLRAGSHQLNVANSGVVEFALGCCLEDFDDDAGRDGLHRNGLRAAFIGEQLLNSGAVVERPPHLFDAAHLDETVDTRALIGLVVAGNEADLGKAVGFGERKCDLHIPTVPDGSPRSAWIVVEELRRFVAGGFAATVLGSIGERGGTGRDWHQRFGRLRHERRGWRRSRGAGCGGRNQWRLNGAMLLRLAWQGVLFNLERASNLGFSIESLDADEERAEQGPENGQIHEWSDDEGSQPGAARGAPFVVRLDILATGQTMHPRIVPRQRPPDQAWRE